MIDFKKIKESIAKGIDYVLFKWNKTGLLDNIDEKTKPIVACMLENQEQLRVVTELKKWLGPKGLGHFRDIKTKYGRLDAVWNEGGIPHCVHFREGMQIRNKLRELTNYSWTDHEYDDRWVEYVEKAIA